MDSLYVIRERMQDLYSRYSIVADKAIQFVLAVMTFYMINNNVGFMKTLASPVVALALAIIATFFPPIITVILATALILVHMYSVSIAALVVTALIFLIMYIFYLRFTPKMAIVVLLTPLAFALKIPVVVPISCALLMSPISMVAVGCGTVVYYMMAYMKKAASGMQGGSVKGMMGQIGKYAKQVFQNKELWIVLVAFIICTLVVYTLRKQAIAHAWTIAVITGAVVNIVVVAIGDVAMGVHASYGSLIFGSIGAAVIGVILELFFFSVDYSRSENLSKGMSGKHLTGTVIYGYLWDEKREHWLVDEVAAEVVRRIFSLTLEGYGPYQSACKLSIDRIEIPVVHLARFNEGVNRSKPVKDPYGWGSSTIVNILKKREYLGHTINFKTRKHFKDKKSHYVSEDEWTIFENTHEAII